MTHTSGRCVVSLMLICWIAAVAPLSAQHFKRIPGSLNFVAAGRAEVWGVRCTAVYCSESNVYRFDSSTQKFIQIPKTPRGILAVAVGGGTVLQSDEVWGIDVFQNVYHFDFKTNSFAKVAGLNLFQIAVGYGGSDNCHPYEVWGVFGPNVATPATYRYDYCTSQFEIISNPSSGALSQVATGGGDVWAVSSSSPTGINVWEYSPSGWVNGGQSLQPPFTDDYSQIAVGMNNVWGVDNEGCAWSWNPIQVDSHGYGYCLGGLGSNIQVATGGDGVWALYNTSDANGLLAYWNFQQTTAGGGFSSALSLTSSAVQVAVGSGAGVWAVDSGNRVYAFVRP